MEKNITEKDYLSSMLAFSFSSLYLQICSFLCSHFVALRALYYMKAPSNQYF